MRTSFSIVCFMLFGALAGARTPADYPGFIYDIYVDADIENTWPTEAERYSLLSDWSYGANESTAAIANTWYRKEGSPDAMNGTAFQGFGTELPQLTMNVSGLDPAKTYNVYAVCWCRNDGSFYWYTLAGLDGDPLWICDDENPANSDNIFSIGQSVITGVQLFLGQIGGVSSALVNVDGPAINTNGLNRAWFDGIALKETEPGPFVTLEIEAAISDPLQVAQKPLDGSVLAVSRALGQHAIAQGTRVQIEAPTVGLNCPDVYDFTGITGDVTQSGSVVRLKMDQDASLTVNYKVREYTPVCGDLCRPELQGDTNGDCAVDFDDFLNLASNWLKCTKPECD